MDLTLTLENDNVSIEFVPADPEEMVTFDKYFGDGETFAAGEEARVAVLTAVRVQFGRTEFRARLKPLGLVESGSRDTLKIDVVTRTKDDARYRCVAVSVDPEVNDCRNLTVPDFRAAVLACRILAVAQHWPGGQAEEGPCSSAPGGHG